MSRSVVVVGVFRGRGTGQWIKALSASKEQTLGSWGAYELDKMDTRFGYFRKYTVKQVWFIILLNPRMKMSQGVLSSKPEHSDKTRLCKQNFDWGRFDNKESSRLWDWGRNEARSPFSARIGGPPGCLVGSAQGKYILKWWTGAKRRGSFFPG